MNKPAQTFGLAIVLAHTSQATAANPLLEEIIVTSSRVEMPLRQVGTSLSIVNEREIVERGMFSLPDVLRYEPGITVSNTGGAGKPTSLRIRGENGFRTRVILDGIDVTDTSSPQAGPRLEQLMSYGVQRVEILRGPQGLMYGADAGGIVAVSTKRGEAGFAGGIGGEIGRYGSGQYGAHLGGGNERLDFSLSGSNLSTDGFNSRTTDTTLRDDDGYENTTLHGRAGWNLSDALRAEIIGHYVDGDNEYDECFTIDFLPTDNCEDNFRQDAWRALLSGQGKEFSHEFAYSHNGIKRTFYADNARSFDPLQGELETLEYKGSWRNSDTLRLVYGLEQKNEAIDDGTFDTDRDQQGYYLEYQGKILEDLYFTAGTRYDDSDDFGSESTYRVSAAYLFTLDAGELKLKGTYGTGFRAPSLYEIAYNNGPFSYPPASEVNLAAEESKGYDLGIAFYASSGWFVELVYFDQQIEDEIFFDLLTFSGYLQGDGESTSEGMELTGELPLPFNLAFSGNYTYNDTEDADGLQRLRVPEKMANLGIAFRPWNGRLTINLNLRVSRDVPDEFNGEIDDYELVDLNASYRILENLEVYGRVENLTDENYVEVPTYRASGAAGYAGVRYSF